MHWSNRLDANPLSRATLALEDHPAVDQSIQRIVAALADIRARMDARAALAHQDVAGADHLAVAALDAEEAGIAVAAVARGSLTFLVCHFALPSGNLDVVNA